MICKCGQPATFKARLPIKRGNRRVISRVYYWCEECVKKEKEQTPGTIAIPIEEKADA